MTLRQAIQMAIQVEADDLLLEKALLDVQEDGGVDLEASYSKQHADLVDLAAIEAIKALLSIPDITEGGYSVKYDRKTMQARLTMLEKKQGVWVDETVIPTISDISNLW